ncbi:MAG: hypothetical protein EBS68_14065, partial [Rhodobacteraceae bacterium]|nr:hypothetical protein [Paracoccaceae bacterium]
WPSMNGEFFPSEAFYVPDGQGGSLPVWHAFFENPGLVQFMHRMSGYLLFAFGVVAYLKSRKSPNPETRDAFTLMFGAMLGQVALGIFTVLTVARWEVAISHQILAVFLWALIIYARFNAAYPKFRVVRRGVRPTPPYPPRFRTHGKHSCGACHGNRAHPLCRASRVD